MNDRVNAAGSLIFAIAGTLQAQGLFEYVMSDGCIRVTHPNGTRLRIAIDEDRAGGSTEPAGDALPVRLARRSLPGSLRYLAGCAMEGKTTEVGVALESLACELEDEPETVR